MQSVGRSKTKSVFRQPMPPLCHGCLSSDRELSSIGEFVNMYRNLCDIKTPVAGVSTDIYLCWECTAILKRFKTFRKQVNNAQTLLNLMYNNYRNKKSLPESLSRLKASKTNHDYIILNEEEPDIKPLEKIKQEIDQAEDFENTEFFDDNKDFTYLEDIKSEDPTLIIKLQKLKKEKNTQQHKKKTRNYRYIRSPEDIIVTEQARQSVLSDLWERDRLISRGSGTNCETCMKEFSESESIETHNRNYHEQHLGPHVCSICSTRYPTQAELASHVSSHNTIYCCVVCGLRSLTMQDAVTHASGHKKVVKCRLCRYYCLKVLPDYFVHYKSMHTQFVCDHCGKKCKSKRVLRRHITRQHMECKCDTCGSTFANHRRLKSHIAMVHETDRSEASFCVKCNVQFQNRVRYLRHLAGSGAHAHERERKKKKEPIKCLLCDNRYARRTYMMNHYRYVHMAKSKYHCQQCDKYFLNSSKYNYHQRYVHEGVEKIRNKLCSVCGRGFTYLLNRTSFVNHQRHHEGVEKKRDKLCSVCGRGFTTNRILTNHMRTHTGERPFACAHCDARFAQRTARDTHQQRRHNRNNTDIK